MDLRPGMKLSSAVSKAQVVVVKAPAVGADLACGGVAMLAEANDAPEGDQDLGEGPALGKRYVDEELGLEVLCSRGGAGELTVDGRPLVLKGAKPLPSSD